jgi:hypothetical protein
VRLPFPAVLGFALFAAGSLAAEPPADLKPEAKFLPDDCQMVGVIRVEQLLSSDAFRLLEKESPLIARQQKAMAANLPLPLDQIDRIVLGGPVTGEGEGLFVVHTRMNIDPDKVIWSKTSFDMPSIVKVGTYELHHRRNESYCIVAPKLLVFGKESALRVVLARNREPTFSAALDGALKEADLKATVAFALDVAGVRTARRGDPVPFIPGLQMALTERAADSLALTLKFGPAVEVRAIAVPAAGYDKGATVLKDEATRFAEFHRTNLKGLMAADDVVDIFKLNIVAEPKRVTASTQFGAAPLVRLLKRLAE